MLPPDAPRRLAQASIGAIHLGIPVDAVVQAIALPDSPSFLPRRQGALRGVVEHAGGLVPVIDLARWVDIGNAPPSTDARILVLRDGGRTIALQVDAVGGLIDVQPAQFMRLHHDDNPDDVFHTAVRLPDGGRILSLLEVGRLADLAAVWSTIDPAHETQSALAAASQRAASLTTRSWALLQTGHGRLAVSPGDLAQVIPMPALERFGGGIDTAYCIWRGRHLPVLAAGALIDAPSDAGEDGLLAVIAHDGLALGVPVRAALHLCAIDGAGLEAAGGITASVFDAEGIEVHLLHTARLFARFPEAALSRHLVDADTAAAGVPVAGIPAAGVPVAGLPPRQGAGNASAYIVFEADGLGATPVAAVEHILPLSASVGANMEWRGAAIPVIDLRTPDDMAAAANVLVVRAAGRHVGFVVKRVHALIPPGTGTLYRMGAAAGQRLEFITTGEGAEQVSYRTFDLVARAA